MKKNEQAFVFIVIIGLLLQLSLLAFGQWIMLIGIGLLANTYLFGFSSLLNNESYQQFSQNRKLLKSSKAYQYIPPYAMVLLIIAMLFKFNAWPGANMILAIGLVMLFVGIVFVIKNTGETKDWKMGVYKRAAIIGLLGMSFYALPEFFFFEIVHRDHPDYIEATKNFYEDPQNESYKLKMTEERDKL